jgi:lipopolysaccharide export system protein LptC
MRKSGFIGWLQAWLPLLPLLLLLAGTYWLSQQVLPLPLHPDYRTRHDPDYIVDNFSATMLDDGGAPRFLVAAQKMEHYPDDDGTYLDGPRLTMPYSNQPPVHVSAAHGEVSHNGDEIFLHDEVKIVREASATQSEMTAATSYLHVIPDRNLADTDRPITLTDARTVVNAVGMQLDSKARELKLLSHVRGQYEPAQP